MRAPEAEIDASLVQAGLSPLQRECVLYRLEGHTPALIALKLHKPRRQVDLALAQAATILTGLLEASERAATRFPRDLVFCVRDRRVFDERPPGVVGVTPDRSSDRFQGASLVPGDDVRLGQGLAAALRLGEAETRPSLVPF